MDFVPWLRCAQRAEPNDHVQSAGVREKVQLVLLILAREVSVPGLRDEVQVGNELRTRRGARARSVASGSARARADLVLTRRRQLTIWGVVPNGGV